MPSFTGKLLAALALLTAVQMLPPQPVLANPARPATLQSSDPNTNSQKGTAGATIELRTDAEGVDFNSYLRGL